MKKSLVYIFTLTALIVSTGFTAALSSFATNKDNTPNTLIATDNNLAENPSTTSLSKYENVYIITNPDGSLNKSFVNNTINNSSEPLPLEASITYTLDSNEIKAEDLINKSGHVKITYKFTATKSHQGKLVPFLTVTGLGLNSTKFKNIKINHGKIISESDNILIAGYTFAGLNEDLNTNILPDSFTIEADVTNFELPDTYTFATNELFAEIDTTKLASIDGIINSINELGQAFDQILTGSTELSNGINQAFIGSKKLQLGAYSLSQGASQVNSGAQELSQGANQLAGGLNQLVDFNNGIIDRIDTTTEEVTAIIQELIERYHIDPESELIKRISATVSQYYNTAYSAITTYTGNIEQLANGANKLSVGASQLAFGTTELSKGATELASGTDSLVLGLSQLNTGSQTLTSGLNTFKTQGINKLLDFANNNLTSFTNNLRSTVSVADSYHHYSNSNATSVKFVFKTPALK